MSFGIIPAALIISLAIILVFSLTSRRPLRGLWMVVVLIFLATLSGQLWIRPFGPVYWGVAWAPLIIVALFFFFLIFALLPAAPPRSHDENKAADGALIAMGTFFWVIMVLLIVSIVLGYYRMGYLVA